MLVFLGVLRHPLLMRAPAEFGRLHAFRNEAFDRPRVPEHVHRLRLLGALRVALGNVDALDAGLLHQLGPALAVVLRGFPELEAKIGGKVHKRLLHQPGDHAGIGAAGGDRGGAARVVVLFLEQGLAQRIVGAAGIVGLGVEIEAEPRLDDGVDIEHAELAAEMHQVNRAGVDRQVDAKALAAAIGQQWRQQLLVILLGHRFLDEGDAAVVEQLAVGVARIDDGHPRLVELEMALDERQRSPADRAEADHHHGAADFTVNRPVFIRHFIEHSFKARSTGQTRAKTGHWPGNPALHHRSLSQTSEKRQPALRYHWPCG